MKTYSAIKVLLTCTFLILAGRTIFADEYYSRDPQVTYSDKNPDSNLIVEIPGYKLNSQCAAAIAIGQPEREYAKGIDPQVLEIATGYVIYGGLSFRSEFFLYAAKELGNYILLYFAEPTVMDGGFELVYSKESKNIIGTFFAGNSGWTFEALPLEGATNSSRRLP